MLHVQKQLCSCGAGRDAEIKFEDTDGNMYFCCGEESCKKAFKEYLDDYAFRAKHQGRRRESYESSVNIVNFVLIIMASLGLGYFVLWLFNLI
jgi:hypothetical protein